MDHRNRRRKPLKICLAASTGGHLTQLLRIEEAWRDMPHFFVTPGEPLSSRLTGGAKAYSVCAANRRRPLHVLRMFFQCAGILLKERPNVIVSTGATVGCVLCILVKLTRGRVVWIDTISHPDRLTLSGRIVRPFADLFLVQWPALQKRYRKVTYVGSVL
jgi:UDP-N-acetylglucosamine:LPS N-acetylglucosamine transferase